MSAFLLFPFLLFTAVFSLSLVNLSLSFAQTPPDPSCQFSTQSLTLLEFDLNMEAGQRHDIHIEVKQDTVEKIAAIESKIAVLSIMGAYRSGKSFMMNQLLPAAARGSLDQGKDKPMVAGIRPGSPFVVGHSVFAHTQEVNVHIVPACVMRTEYPDFDIDTTVLYLDTPGLFSPDRAAIFDAQLLALLNLLSSTILFNNLATIGRLEVGQFSSAIDSAMLISFFDTRHNATSLHQQAAALHTLTPSDASTALDKPDLLWLIQNFKLNLPAGMNAKQYVEKSLRDADLASNHTAAYVDKFNQFFRSFDVVALDYPADVKDLTRLTELTEAEFNPEYVKQLKELKHKLFSSKNAMLHPKRVGSVPLSGSFFTSLLQQYTDFMNTPTSVLKQQMDTRAFLNALIDKQVDKAFDDYKQCMKALHFPMTGHQLNRLHSNEFNRLTAGKENLFGFKEKLQEKINDEYTAFQAMNEAMSDKEFTQQYVKKSKAAVEEYERNMTAGLELPQSESSLQQRHVTLLQQVWYAKKDELTKIPATNSDGAPLHATEVAALATKHTSLWLRFTEQAETHCNQTFQRIEQDNFAASLKQCVAAAQALQKHYATAPWFMSMESRASFNQRLAEAVKSTDAVNGPRFCSGPAIKSEQMRYEFDKIVQQFEVRLRMRILVATLLLCFGYTYAIRALFAIPTLYTRLQRETTKDLKRNGMTLNLPVLAVVMCVEVCVLVLVPDAIWLLWLHAAVLAVLSVALIMVATIAFKVKGLKRTRSNRADSYSKI